MQMDSKSKVSIFKEYFKIGKNLKRLFFIFLAVVVLNNNSIISSRLAQAEETDNGSYVVAYYFHGAFRCSACHKLEQYSKEVIGNNFKDALAFGKLKFKVINIEDKGNEHYGKDYQLYAKSLILSLIKGGKEVKWTNLDKIWEYGNDKQEFIDYLKSNVTDFLKEIK